MKRYQVIFIPVLPMNFTFNRKFLFSFAVLIFFKTYSHSYYVHPILGDDTHTGLSKAEAFKSLEKINQLNLKAGDSVFLAKGEVFYGSLILKNLNGEEKNPIYIGSKNWDANLLDAPALIDFKNYSYGIQIQNCSYVELHNLNITGEGYSGSKHSQNMTCGVLIHTQGEVSTSNIVLKNLALKGIFHENKGFTRGADEVNTANGTQAYGWGILLISDNPRAGISRVRITGCSVIDVSHTGIKLTGNKQNISDVEILNNLVYKTGGPGIQMSEVASVYVADNFVSHSGSDDDSRKWGRGSGLWTWGSSNVLIEKNKFLYANGPGDSAGAHIDFNCDNIVLQYNISAYNAGGFCEILGNNYNCSYRFNLSINDGNRTKGKDGAFQEGKIFWLSGYQGTSKKRKGPVNTYFYNNTIYSDGSYEPKVAIERTSRGILIANNIFCIKGETKLVLGDQYRPEVEDSQIASNVVFENNLFWNSKSWPAELSLQDTNPKYGDPVFKNPGGLNASDYIPLDSSLINKGISIPQLPGDNQGLPGGLQMSHDLLGKTIEDAAFLGAIKPE